jgi:hypothetical protein
MSSGRNGNQVSLHDVPSDVIQNDLSYYLPFNDQVSLFATSKHFHQFSEVQSKQYLMHKLLSAVIDDEFTQVRLIIGVSPDLLLEDYTKIPGWLIRSKYSKQIFKPEHPIRLAVRRNQYEMVKLLLGYMAEVEYHKVLKLEYDHLIKQQVLSEQNAQIHKKNYYRLLFPLLHKTILADERATQADLVYLQRGYESFQSILLNQRVTDLELDLDQAQVISFTPENLLLAAIDLVNVERIKYNWRLVEEQFNYFYVNLIGFLQRLLAPSVKALLLQSRIFDPAWLHSSDHQKIRDDLHTWCVGEYALLGAKYFIASDGCLERRAIKSGFEEKRLQHMLQSRSRAIQRLFLRQIKHIDLDPTDVPEPPCFTCQVL